MQALKDSDCTSTPQSRGSRDGVEGLVCSNLGLVVAIARRYRNAGVPLEELIAEGNLGLVNAAHGFDPSCGSRFSTYAAYWIRQGISRAFAANSPRGRLSGRARRELMELERAARAHLLRTGSNATDAELAQLLHWPPERVAACRAMCDSHARPRSLDRAGVDPCEPEASLSGPAVASEQMDAGTTVDRLLETLPPFERNAVEMRFGLHGTSPRGVGAIAASLEHSRRETRRALVSAMSALTRHARAEDDAALREAGSRHRSESRFTR